MRLYAIGDKNYPNVYFNFQQQNFQNICTIECLLPTEVIAEQVIQAYFCSDNIVLPINTSMENVEILKAE